MIIGFTGTRNGMTGMQLFHLEKFMRQIKSSGEYIEVHHGDCVGADQEFHHLSRLVGVDKIVIHPPVSPKLRAYCQGDVLLPEKPYDQRNLDIVLAVGDATTSDIVFGSPFTTYLQTTGGTWQTIRYAKSRKRRVMTLYPDGRVALVDKY